MSFSVWIDTFLPVGGHQLGYGIERCFPRGIGILTVNRVTYHHPDGRIPDSLSDDSVKLFRGDRWASQGGCSVALSMMSWQSRKSSRVRSARKQSALRPWPPWPRGALESSHHSLRATARAGAGPGWGPSFLSTPPVSSR